MTIVVAGFQSRTSGRTAGESEDAEQEEEVAIGSDGESYTLVYMSDEDAT